MRLIGEVSQMGISPVSHIETANGTKPTPPVHTSAKSFGSAQPAAHSVDLSAAAKAHLGGRRR